MADSQWSIKLDENGSASLLVLPLYAPIGDNSALVVLKPLMSSLYITRLSPIHGNGVFAIAPIKKGTRLIQYQGSLLTHKQVDRIYADDVETGHTFLFTLNEHFVIDANVGGNDARWINHSCDPNCEAVIEEDDDGNPTQDKVFIEAMRAIKPGEELTYNYGIVLEEAHTARLKKLWACLCGSKKCTGTMLQPKRKKKE